MGTGLNTVSIDNLTGTNEISTDNLVDRDEVFGFDQSWQDVTSSRSGGVTYTNTTGKPILVIVGASNSSAIGLYFLVDGVEVSRCSILATIFNSVYAVVSPGSTYESNWGNTGKKWLELR